MIVVEKRALTLDNLAFVNETVDISVIPQMPSERPRGQNTIHAAVLRMRNGQNDFHPGYIPLGVHTSAKIDVNFPAKGVTLQEVSGSSCVISCPVTSKAFVASITPATSIPQIISTFRWLCSTETELLPIKQRKLDVYLLKGHDGWSSGMTNVMADWLDCVREQLAKEAHPDYYINKCVELDATDTGGAFSLRKDGLLTLYNLHDNTVSMTGAIILMLQDPSDQEANRTFGQARLLASLEHFGSCHTSSLYLRADATGIQTAPQIPDIYRGLIRALRLKHGDAEAIKALYKLSGHREKLDMRFMGLKMLIEVYTSDPKFYICDAPACSERGTMVCSNCKGAYYCCREHQQKAWKGRISHKRWCKANPLL